MDTHTRPAEFTGIHGIVTGIPAHAAVLIICHQVHAGPVAAGLSNRAGRLALAGIVSWIHAVPRTAELPGGTCVATGPAAGFVSLEVPAGPVAAGLERRLERALHPAGPAVEGIGLQIGTGHVTGTAFGLMFTAEDEETALAIAAVEALTTIPPARPAVLVIRGKVHAPALAVRGPRCT